MRMSFGLTPRPLVSLISVVVVLLLRLPAIGGSWVDPDTPARKGFTEALTEGDSREYYLVFSDEFEVEGRNFHDGNDPRWTAIDKNDYTNSALHYYSPYNANTTKGVLSITTERKVNAYRAFNEKTKEFYLDKKHIQTGMVQSWNKFCIVGGIVEFSARLPGDPQVGGLWPALWMLGNLARATYVGSSNFMWPYSYNKCDDANRVSQEISACSKVNHYNMESYRGRGAPEIDVIESMQGETGKLPSTFIQRPYQSASLQIAPGIENKRPNMGSRPHPDHWYTDLEYGNSSPVDLNPFFYGVTLEHKPRSHTYQADAVSANLQLNDTHYEDQHIYRVEWEPPAEDGTGGYVRWYTDDEFVFGLTGDSLDITGTEIPSEPMYLIMNTAVSSNWGFPAPCPEGCDCKCFECGNPDCSCAIPDGYCENLPSSFEIDYVRVYQAVDDPKHILGCSPESRPTEVFIQGHLDRYKTNGQSKALQPVVSGGADCDRDRDCGGHERGHCDTSGACQCSKYFTGPKCLAHNGFYDVDTGRPPQTLPLDHMILPKSLIVVVLLLAIGLLLAVCVAVQNKKKEFRYIPVAKNGRSSNGNDGRVPAYGQGSYQHQLSGSYAMPSNAKDVTYCIIDERLVDS